MSSHVTLSQAPAGAKRLRAGHLPSGWAQRVDWQVLSWGDLHIEVPAPTPEQLSALAAHLRRQRAATVLSLADIMSALDAVVHRLLDADAPQRQALDLWLSQITGLDARMLRLGLTAYLERFRQPQLQRFVVEDLGNPALLDGFEPRTKGGLSHAAGPPLLVHVWAGNVPGLPLWSLVAGCLVKAGHLAKLPSAEPLVASMFAQCLAEQSPALGESMAVVWWPGGDVSREQAAFAPADVLMAYGDNPTLSALRARVPITTRFLPFGHKLSFGMVDRAALDQRRLHEVVHEAALDVVRFEQQGCYSPQLFYVARGGVCSPSDFAHHLQQQLRALSHRYPRRALDFSERQALADWRHAQQTAAMRGELELLGDDSDPYAVVLRQTGVVFEPTALNRCVQVVAVDELLDVPPVLHAHRHLLQTVGVTTEPRRLLAISKALAQAGVTRICAIGDMTLPEAGWHHDGRFNLADLVQMVDIEHSAEQAADSMAPYRD